jgi:hypothetical protein
MVSYSSTHEECMVALHELGHAQQDVEGVLSSMSCWEKEEDAWVRARVFYSQLTGVNQDDSLESECLSTYWPEGQKVYGLDANPFASAQVESVDESLLVLLESLELRKGVFKDFIQAHMGNACVCWTVMSFVISNNIPLGEYEEVEGHLLPKSFSPLTRRFWYQIVKNLVS